MRNIRHNVLLCILSGGLSIGASAEEIIAIKADRVDTVTSGVIENGIIVIADGKIKAPKPLRVGQKVFRFWTDQDIERVRRHKKKTYWKGRGGKPKAKR